MTEIFTCKRKCLRILDPWIKNNSTFVLGFGCGSQSFTHLMAVDCARLSFYFCSRDTLAWGIYQKIQQQIPPDIWCHLHPKDSSWTNIFPCIEESLELPSVQEVTYSRCNIVHFSITFLWSLKSFVIVLDPNSNSYPEEQNIIFFEF